MDLKLDSSTLGPAISEAIMLQLDDDIKEQLIKQALHDLFARQKIEKRWGGEETGPSKIEQLFQQAIYDLTRKTMTDLVKDDEEIRSKIQELSKSAALKFLSTGTEGIADLMASMMTSSLQKAWENL